MEMKNRLKSLSNNKTLTEKRQEAQKGKEILLQHYCWLSQNRVFLSTTKFLN